MNIRRN